MRRRLDSRARMRHVDSGALLRSTNYSYRQQENNARHIFHKSLKTIVKTRLTFSFPDYDTVASKTIARRVSYSRASPLTSAISFTRKQNVRKCAPSPPPPPFPPPQASRHANNPYTLVHNLANSKFHGTATSACTSVSNTACYVQVYVYQ